jgi:hypothetical protein
MSDAEKCREINTTKSNMQVMQGKIISTNGLKRQKNSKYIISYGGGVNSTAMMVFLVENKYPIDAVVFSDTGGEMPETYEYLKHAKTYLKKHNIPFVDVMNFRKQSLYDKSLRRKVIPSTMWRWCTRDFKVLPIYRYYKTLNSHVCQYVGIAYDEVHRMKDPTEDFVTNVYPLVDFGIDREQCIKIIKDAKLPIPIKSGCYFCPFKGMESWNDLYNKHPELYKKARKLEENSKHFPEQKLTPLTLGVLEKHLKKGKLPMIEVENPCGSECMI